MRPLIALVLTLSMSMVLAVPIVLEAAGAATPVVARAETATAAPAPRYVREAQRALRDLGYQPGPVDGVVGPKTKEALTKYQRAERIAVTGRLDSETMVRLDIQKRLFAERTRAR